MDKYRKKRSIIIAVYLAIFILSGWLIYFLTRTTETCMDGVRNQNEEGVDCGGTCTRKCDKIVIADLQVEQSGFVENGIVGKIDLYGKVYNPNNVMGSNRFQYEFKIKDSQGQILSVKKGVSFILPGENKYIIENNIEAGGAPASVELSIVGTDWVEFKDQYEKPQIKIVNKEYNQITSGVGFSEAKGLLKNESLFDFSLIEVTIILKNSANEIVALNSTEMRTVRSGENRDFKSVWFSRFNGEVASVEVQSEVDIFNSETYSQKYFSPENLPNR